MKILLPFKEDLNPYLQEIIAFSECEYIYDHFKNYSPDFDIVNIHWPEALFDWWEPSLEQLIDLEKDLRSWKKTSLIVYTKHDDQRNKGNTVLFERLFKLIEAYADIFIHLGEFSKIKYESNYPEAMHLVVPHPLYENSYKVFAKGIAREKLGISHKSLVIAVPGTIRSFEERKLILNAFKSIKNPDKVLIAFNMRTELRRDFRGRIALKRYFDIKKYLINRFKAKYKPPTYIFTYERLAPEDFSIRVSAADVVMIPRVNILNSGNVFLAFTFRKVVLGPATGNIEETLQKFEMPLFDPSLGRSVNNAMKEAIILFENGYNYSEEQIASFNPQNIAKALDEIFFNHSK